MSSRGEEGRELSGVSLISSLLFLVAQSCPTLCNPMDCNLPAPLSVGFPSQEYWSGLSFPSPGDLPSPGIEPEPPAWQADSLLLSHQGSLLYKRTSPFLTALSW